MVRDEAENDTTIYTESISQIVFTKGIIKRQLPYLHFRLIKIVLKRQMELSRELEMADLDGFVALI